MKVEQALLLSRGLNINPLDVELLLCFFLDKNRAWLIAHNNEQIAPHIQQQFQQGLRKLQQGTPISYLLGTKEFWSLEFDVNPSVLIPRHDTEVIVETSLSISPTPKSVLDLGTGSGVIAIVLALELPKTQVYAVDYSTKALETAEHNAKKHDVKNIHFVHSHWYRNLKQKNFDLIVSNPPYIEENDLHLKDLSHEPLMALVSGENGLTDIHQIIKNAPNHLTTNGHLIIEHGYNQSKQVQKLFIDYGFEKVKSIKDLAGIFRVTMGMLKGKNY